MWHKYSTSTVNIKTNSKYVCVSEHYIQCICRLKLFTSLILLFIDLAFINLKSIYHLSLQLLFLAPTILLFCLIYFLCCLASFTVLFLCHLPLLFHSFPLLLFYSVFINVLVQGWEGRRSGDMKHTSLQQKKKYSWNSCLYVKWKLGKREIKRREGNLKSWGERGRASVHSQVMPGQWFSKIWIMTNE